MNTSLVHVPFYGTILFLVDVNGEPYTPMKPIVDGMGLDWRSQQRKLASLQERWGMVIMTIPSEGGAQETLCMPLRKLPGWLMSIQVSRLKPEIREKALAFQNECDDVLWEYWTKGIAVNPRGVSEFDRLVRRIDALTQRVARLENLSRSSPPSGRPPEESVPDPKKGERSGGNAPIFASDSGEPPRAESGVLSPTSGRRNHSRSPAQNIPKGTKIPTAYSAIFPAFTFPPPEHRNCVSAFRGSSPPQDSG
uniref:Antirepressor protein ant N-terminal domain-containing protein n=1 Tax=Leptospirillum ferrodiazotrophum TaxID=412449 RepID=C6HX00_9BACT|nr:MAG: hypothetical protein UBAL3_92050001 [Leptospirillum ferrodiazotrophum]